MSSLLCAAGTVFAAELPAAGEATISTNKYQLAYVDVIDTGHPGKDKLGAETTISGMIRDYLRELGIEGDIDDNPLASLHVICRFKYKVIWPEITQGGTIVMTEVGQCSIKIVDKKTDKVLVDQSWTRGKKNGTLDDFIKAVFLEFGKQLGSSAVQQGSAGVTPQTTNSITSPSANAATNNRTAKGK